VNLAWLSAKKEHGVCTQCTAHASCMLASQARGAAEETSEEREREKERERDSADDNTDPASQPAAGSLTFR
jgi:hypothetical protein